MMYVQFTPQLILSYTARATVALIALACQVTLTIPIRAIVFLVSACPVWVYISYIYLRSHKSHTSFTTTRDFILIYLRCLAGKLFPADTHNGNGLRATLTCPATKPAAITPLCFTRKNIKDLFTPLTYPPIQWIWFLLWSVLRAFAAAIMMITREDLTGHAPKLRSTCCAGQEGHDKTSYCGVSGLFRDHYATIGGVR